MNERQRQLEIEREAKERTGGARGRKGEDNSREKGPDGEGKT
jgi:hypothetical protein